MEEQDQSSQEPLQGAPPAPVVPESEPPAPAPAPSPADDQPPAPDISPAPQPSAPPVQNERMADFRSVAAAARRKKHEVLLEKLLAYARGRGRITNNDIQRILRVSDATATRYAKILIGRGLLKRIGKTRGAAYEPTA